MTSPPDVQKVPDVWGLLEEAANVERVDRDRLYYFVGRVRTALAQRDRFVLVPKEADLEMSDAYWADVNAAPLALSGASKEELFRHRWVNVLAAAPKPEGKP